MYSVKPWGRSAVIGSTVGAFAVGVGMRWRETVVEVIDTHANPAYELQNYRRCVLSQNSVRLLGDMGIKENILMKELRPARQWRFMTHELEVMREGDQYPGCAPSEDVYHVSYGRLLRALRREFLRYGGTMFWHTEASEPFPCDDSSGFWALNREYGASRDLECIVGTAQSWQYGRQLLHGLRELQTEPKELFNVKTGVCGEAPEAVLQSFGREADYCIILGRKYALHYWRPEPLLHPKLVSWRMTSFAAADTNMGVAETHPDVRTMLGKSKHVLDNTIALPTTALAVEDESMGARVTHLGSAMLPVDQFEFRGDEALTAIEDAAALVKKLYGTRYHRGFVPLDMREYEMDAVAKRLQLLQRDFRDADTFLSAIDQVPERGAAQEVTAGEKGVTSPEPVAEEAKEK